MSALHDEDRRFLEVVRAKGTTDPNAVAHLVRLVDQVDASYDRLVAEWPERVDLPSVPMGEPLPFGDAQ